ncbi:MAG: bifunctional diaminohydroxyphosphoribosylaminopyrimidine deaminase/5-amino-6-(5-phosphoribosylamino)uracil reductase RibD [Candidatus Nanopelagicales bacterium]
MSEALALAVSDDAPRGVNPRVGCVLVRDSRVIGRGYHRGAGTAHAEAAALAAATESPRGATAVVTLEPCAHVGRTDPCADALIEAGISRVVLAQPDPTEQAAGGAARLRTAGVEVVTDVLLDQALAVNADWTFMKLHDRPHVTLKLAGSLDGRVDSAGADRLILTGPEAQAQVQRLRAGVDAIAVGTGTITSDDPRLTVRGYEVAVMPLRVVLGTSTVPSNARVGEDGAEVMRISERDPHAALALLADRGIQRLLLEGGPTVAAAYLEAGVVDEVHWYVSPLLVGDGPMALSGLSAHVGLDVTGVDVVGEDVRIIGVPAVRGS